MELHSIIEVRATAAQDTYIAQADITDMTGERRVVDYVSAPNDAFGLAPVIRVAVDQWIAAGNPVTPYTPPTLEELRASMSSLTPRQLRLGLVANGISLTQVEDAIAAIADPVEREAAQIEWEWAGQYERLHPLISMIGSALSLTETQIDDMWTSSATL